MSLRYLFLLACLFVSTLAAATAPVAICSDQVYMSLPSDACTVSVWSSHIDANSYDPDGNALTRWTSGGHNLGPGTYIVRLYVSDGTSTNSCVATVTVEDKTRPRVTCHPQTVYLVAPDQPFTLNVADMVTFSDNCSVSGQVNVADVVRTSFGVEYFTGEGSDPSGNTTYCLSTVTTVDAEPQNYCASNRNDHYEHIANINLTTSSGTLNHSSGSNGGYNWHYPTNGNVLYHGFNYNLAYTPGFRFSSTYHEYWRVYLDKNADGDFNDSGELLHQWHGYGGNSFTFSSPGTVWGWSRIRVVMSYGSYAGPCGGGYGETEDISVYLRPYFFIPWPGLRTVSEEVTAHAAGNHALEIPLTENRPEEAPRAGETALRSGLDLNTPAVSVPTTVKLYPNPVRAGERLTVSGHPSAHPLQLFNLAGKVVSTYPGQTRQLDIPAHLPAGIYLLRGQDWSRRVVVR